MSTKTIKTLGIIGTVIISIISAFGGYYIVKNLSGGNKSKQQIIKDAVVQINKTSTLPMKLDSITEWTSISEQPNAFRYEYLISGADTTDLSSESLKPYLAPSACKNEATRKLLDADINLEYSYSVKDSDQKYFVIISKTDC